MRTQSTQIPHVGVRSYRSWTPDMDDRVRNAIFKYNKAHPIKFPELPSTLSSDKSQKRCYICLKKIYLRDLDRDSKQVRERWLNHLSPKIRGVSVLEEDEEIIWSLCKENSNKWVKVALKFFEASNQESYYSDNAIKNFYLKCAKKKVNSCSSATFVPLFQGNVLLNSPVDRVNRKRDRDAVCSPADSCFSFEEDNIILNEE